MSTESLASSSKRASSIDSITCGSSSRSSSPSSIDSTMMDKIPSRQSDGGRSSTVVIRCGHIIPSIRLTPPDDRPAKAPEVPEQDLGPNSLYVPLRTEEVGWEEGGLIWAPKRFFYPTVNLYGGPDDHVIGQYRGGPKGYRYIKITDPHFALANADEDQVHVTDGGKTSTGDQSKSKMPRGPVQMVKNDEQQASSSNTEDLEMATSAAVQDDELDASSDTVSSSAGSSRQGSFSSIEEGVSSGADTGMTTPAQTESPVQEDKGVFAKRLDDALSALSPSEQGTVTGLSSRHDRTVTLTDKMPELNTIPQRGRSISRSALLDAPTYVQSTGGDNDYAAGWAYEQNTRIQHAARQSMQADMVE